MFLEITDLTEQVAASMRGFPGKDADSHRRYHETMIEELAERRKLRMAIQEKTISGLVWALVLGLAWAIWHEVLRQLGVAQH